MPENYSPSHDAANHILPYEDDVLSSYPVSESDKDNEAFDTDDEDISHIKEVGDHALENEDLLRTSEDPIKTVGRQSRSKEEEPREMQDLSLDVIDNDDALSFQFDPNGEWCEISLNVSFHL